MELEIIVTFKNLEKVFVFDNPYVMGDIKIGRQITTDNLYPSYGVVPSFGNAKLADKPHYIDSLYRVINENDVSDETILVNIFLDGGMVFVSEAELGYDFINRIIHLEFVDSLFRWQNIVVNYTFLEHYRLTQSPTITALALYNKLKTITQSLGEEFEALDATTLYRLSNIGFNLPNFRGQSLKDVWDNLCKATQCYLYKLYDGRIRVVYVG